MLNKIKNMLKKDKEMIAEATTPEVSEKEVMDALDEVDVDVLEQEIDAPADEIEGSYEDEYLEYSAEAVGYETREHQWNVYRMIANYIGEGDSVIDFGCGRGDFERFFQTEYQEDIDYVGVDMNQQLIDAGNKVYDEEVELVCSDWFSLDDDLVRDWAINIGSSNLRYDADTVRDDMTYMQDTVKAMMKHCNKGAIVLLASDNLQTDDGLTNWNAGEVLNWAQKEFGNVAVDHSFSEDLFTVLIYKN